LFTHLKASGAQILAAGASDWVVYPGAEGYPADEAFFLHCILDFLVHSLKERTDVDQAAFSEWILERRQQIEQGELIYIAHQIDFLGAFSKG
jgi:hypothetical protein